MLKSSLLFITMLGIVPQAQANNHSDRLIAAGIAVGAVAASCLSYKAYTHWLLKRVRAHFSTSRAILNHYAQWSTYAHSWTTRDAEQLLQDIKNEIVRLHNRNCDRWDISVMHDIYYDTPAMYVSSRYKHYPLLQFIEDINWYLAHLKFIRFCGIQSNNDELSLLIEQLAYIKELILSDYAYSREGADYQLRNDIRHATTNRSS